MMCLTPEHEPRFRRPTEGLIQANGGQKVNTESADFYAEEDAEAVRLAGIRECGWIGPICSLLGWAGLVAVAAGVAGATFGPDIVAFIHAAAETWK